VIGPRGRAGRREGNRAKRNIYEYELFNDVLAVGLLGVVLVAVPTRQGSAEQQLAPSGVAKGDDVALQLRIATNLQKSASLAARDIDVDVEQGIVTLTGTVRSEAEKARAGRLAKVSGVTRVNNAIEVDPKIDRSKIDTAGAKTKAGVTKAVDATINAAAKTKEGVQKGLGKAEQGVGKAADKTSDAVGQVGDKMTDNSVTTLVKAGFSGETLLRDSAIDVDTTNHVVTLRGTVASNAAKARATAIAGATEGVTRVVNELDVKGTEPDLLCR
jgi:hyperosmotically inducible periplasmic protein